MSYGNSYVYLFEELQNCSPKHCFTFPSAVCEVSKMFTFYETLTIVYPFDESYPSGCEMVSLVELVCISLMTSTVEHLFMC